jgi:hypothetical protein
LGTNTPEGELKPGTRVPNFKMEMDQVQWFYGLLEKLIFSGQYVCHAALFVIKKREDVYAMEMILSYLQLNYAHVIAPCLILKYEEKQWMDEYLSRRNKQHPIQVSYGKNEEIFNINQSALMIVRPDYYFGFVEGLNVPASILVKWLQFLFK